MLLVLAWAVTDSLLSFYALWAVIGLVMATVLYEPAFAVMAVWFDRKRARALTALTLIAGFSSTAFLPLTAWLVQAQGWRSALVSLAMMLAVGAPFLSMRCYGTNGRQHRRRPCVPLNPRTGEQVGDGYVYDALCLCVPILREPLIHIRHW